MGKRYGMGRMTFPDGSRYVGEWVSICKELNEFSVQR